MLFGVVPLPQIHVFHALELLGLYALYKKKTDIQSREGKNVMKAGGSIVHVWEPQGRCTFFFNWLHGTGAPFKQK